MVLSELLTVMTMKLQMLSRMTTRLSTLKMSTLEKYALVSTREIHLWFPFVLSTRDVSDLPIPVIKDDILEHFKSISK